MSEIREIRLTVNGKSYQGRCEPRKLLVDFVREDLGLTGTHIGCEHGICGACTILFNGEAARSCLMFAVQAEGAELLTVEGLAKGDEYHPLQQAFHEHHALQCGYCTPGMLIAALDFLATNPCPTPSSHCRASGRPRFSTNSITRSNPDWRTTKCGMSAKQSPSSLRRAVTPQKTRPNW